MSRSIVCGVDGSDESLAAAAFAAQLCERLGVALLLAHFVRGWTTFSDADEAQLSRHRRRIDAEMTRVFQRIERRFSRVEIAGRVLTGVPAEELPTLAAEENAALIVVGSRGRGDVKAALFGSVSSAVTRASDRPVVIVPPNAVGDPDMEAVERSVIVCGVDHSEEGSSAARVAAQLATALRGGLVLVHAYAAGPSPAAIPAPGAAPSIAYEDRSAKRREAARALLEYVAANVAPNAAARMRVEGGDPASALDRCAEAENAELIVVGLHRRGAVASMLRGSTFSRLAASASRPVVAVPAGASLEPGTPFAPRVADGEWS